MVAVRNLDGRAAGKGAGTHAMQGRAAKIPLATMQRWGPDMLADLKENDVHGLSE